jgi:hypothetical protein
MRFCAEALVSFIDGRRLEDLFEIEKKREKLFDNQAMQQHSARQASTSCSSKVSRMRSFSNHHSRLLLINDEKQLPTKPETRETCTALSAN